MRELVLAESQQVVAIVGKKLFVVEHRIVRGAADRVVFRPACDVTLQVRVRRNDRRDERVPILREQRERRRRELLLCGGGQRAGEEIRRAAELFDADRSEEVPRARDAALTGDDIGRRLAHAGDDPIPRPSAVGGGCARLARDREMEKLRKERVDNRIRRTGVIFLSLPVHRQIAFESGQLCAQKQSIVAFDKRRVREVDRFQRRFPRANQREIGFTIGERRYLEVAVIVGEPLGRRDQRMTLRPGEGHRPREGLQPCVGRGPRRLRRRRAQRPGARHRERKRKRSAQNPNIHHRVPPSSRARVRGGATRTLETAQLKNFTGD